MKTELTVGDKHQVRLLNVLERVNEVMLRAVDLQEMLEDLLDEILSIFACDRAWLLFPCDPDAEAWRVPVERTVPAWPGAMAQDLELPMTPDVQALFAAVLATREPLVFHPDTAQPVPEIAFDQFHVRSQITLAIRPKVGQPWLLGIHHCEAAHLYTAEERSLFVAIGRRLGDALVSLIALRDLREREGELRRSQSEREALISDLEQRNAELERIVYTISHQLRTPLVSIHNYADALGEDLGEVKNDAVEEDLDRIQSSCLRMRTLLDELLTLMRVGRVVGEVTDFPLDAVVRAAQEEVDLAGATLQVVGGDCVLRGDRARFVDVLRCLLDNAVKFRGDAPPAIRVSAEALADGVVVRVSDNGVGIPAEYHDRVFTLFERLDPSAPGSGAGLAIVKRIVEHHGGRVRVAPAEAGTTIELELPRLPAGAEKK